MHGITAQKSVKTITLTSEPEKQPIRERVKGTAAGSCRPSKKRLDPGIWRGKIRATDSRKNRWDESLSIK